MGESAYAGSSLTPLLEQLLDAHADTLRLSTGDLQSVEWSAHRAYLRDLQRAGYEALARIEAPELR
jgi:hypothetical protein